MFFYIAKILYFLVAPSHFLIFCGLAGLAASWVGWVRFGRALTALAIVGLAVIAFSPISLLIALPLEERIPPPEPAPGRIDGIIVLGGSVNTLVSAYKQRRTLADSAERIVEIAGLARLYPDAKIVFTGGSSAIWERSVTEAEVAAGYFESFGIAKDRLVIEDRARNTWQNAVYSREMADPQPGETWLLVTSAFHMPRSLGVFRQAGWSGIVPWPVDYRVGGAPDTMRMRTNAGLSIQLMDLAVKEWIGLVAYRLTGRTDRLFPGL